MDESVGKQGTVVCVVGPGRSGTSLTMRILNLLGVDVGPSHDLIPPGQGNPSGYWENAALTKLNTRILKVMGGDVLNPPLLPPGWETLAALGDEREHARALLSQIAHSNELWGWKCPIASLTLPFWQQLLPDMRYVICLRNPLSMAASLTEFSRRRTVARPLALWTHYAASALVNTANAPRMVVSYEDYFEDLGSAATRLARFVGRAPPTPERLDEIETTFDNGLCHHGSTLEDLLEDREVPPETVSLYLGAKRLASSDTGNDPGQDARASRVNDHARRLLECRQVAVAEDRRE
jgi:hypothetical protein